MRHYRYVFLTFLFLQVTLAQAGWIITHSWDFNENGGATAFDSLQSRTASVASGVTLGSGFATFSGDPYPGNVINFGSGTGVSGTSDFALEFRMRSTQGLDSPVSGYGSPVEILGTRDTQSHGYWVEVRAESATGCPYASIDNNDPGHTSGFTVVTAGCSPSTFDGAWHTVRLERQSESLALIVDGVLATNYLVIANVAADIGVKNLLLGSSQVASFLQYPPIPFGVRQYVGDIDYLRIFAFAQNHVPEPSHLLLLGLACSALFMSSKAPREISRIFVGRAKGRLVTFSRVRSKVSALDFN